MNRKILFCMSLALSAAVHLYRLESIDPGFQHPVFFVVRCLVLAFYLPAVPWVSAWHHYFGFGADQSVFFWNTLYAIFVWFFPIGRVERWLGTYDAFRNTQGGRPPLRTAAAFVISELDKRLFGREKSGRWA